MVWDGAELTYAELDRAADRLADRLAGLGVGGEDRVGVLAGRSAGQVIAVLAILKAGAAYLPVDTRAPAPRMRQLLAQAGARAVLCDRAWHDTATGLHHGPTLLRSTRTRCSPAAAPPDRPECPVLPGRCPAAWRGRGGWRPVRTAWRT